MKKYPNTPPLPKRENLASIWEAIQNKYSDAEIAGALGISERLAELYRVSLCGAHGYHHPLPPDEREAHHTAIKSAALAGMGEGI